MTSARTSYLTAGGLVVLLIGLFAAIFSLNARHYQTALSNAESAVAKALDEQRDLLLSQLDREETRAFALMGTERIFDADLFQLHEGRFLPASLADGFTHTVSRPDANAAFKKGVALLPAKDALPFFEIAARAAPENSADWYQKISALFNVLDFRTDPSVASQILFALEQSRDALSASRKAFFRGLLEERFPDITRIETRQNELLKTAERLNADVVVKKGAFRVAVGDEILAVGNNGVAVLYAPDFGASNAAALSFTPKGIHRELLPGLYITASKTALDEEKRRLAHQYQAGNITLTIMAALGALLCVGLGVTFLHQRKLNAMRTRFIATVSHELRTPLSLIRLHAETLAHGRVPSGKENDYHQTILTETDRLTGIVNNVLDFSRMERDKLQVHLETTSLSELTARVADSFRDRLREDQIELERNIAADVSGLVDPLAYSQVVFNLLDNAIKYSDGAKSIRIGLEVSNGWNILTVEDQGIGIPNKLKKHVFNEFVRSDDRKVTARRGSGIGLNVAKRLVEKMNGTIEVADNKPKGSIFTVILKSANGKIME
ncbi:HAMP domain-containing sensor histidine kinase [Pontiellaceae bacterium B1224]|nr:HAMP domain-containing sensor histidine kinase [Pontiellaceae bacterium B1224]